MIIEDRVRKNLRRLEAMGYKQHELANLAGISRVSINTIMNKDAEPKIQTCERLAVSLGLDPMAIFFSEEQFEAELEKIAVMST
ncbi:helix-turn-helix transcriptional regulator [Schlesneria paludicola]|uniref:helix-turn-helix transcriptional regulator n=1 Tax=Schlesneria paludicola TaxID=360056 RepID=UPI00029AD989|nr:helix-turn-helix transcriptional regulator [Schlesneria paludicola]